MAQSAEAVFVHWTDGTIAMFANWGTITFLLGIVPMAWLLEYNLRYSVVLTAGLVAAATTLRCIGEYYTFATNKLEMEW